MADLIFTSRSRTMPLMGLATPPLLCVIEFAAPALASAAALAGVPILVHLILAQRPRKQILPTLRFLTAAHHAANRMHRLKRLLLLACRMLLLVLIAVLMMRPIWSPAAGASGPARPSAGPVAAVFAFDNSASMGYRYQGQTRLDAALEAARSFLGDAARFPPGSQFAIVSGPPATIAPAWLEASAAAATLTRLALGDHDLSGSRLLDSAYTLLRKTKQSVGEVYLFTDLTTHGWSGSISDAPAQLTGLFVIDVGQPQLPNISITDFQPQDRLLPADQPAEISLNLSARGMPWEGQLALEIDGQPRAARQAVPIAADTTEKITLTLPAMSPGPHRLRIAFEPHDALSCDDERFAVVQAGALPKIELLTDDHESETARILRAMIAPPAAPLVPQRFAIHSATPAGWPRPHSGTGIIILADAVTLSNEQWNAAEAFVRADGALLIVPGSQTPAYTGPPATRLLPAAVLGIEELDPPLSLAATDLSHPFLRPFAGEDIDSLNARRAFRRLRLGPLQPGAQAIAPFSDARPALLERRVGSGRVILLAFSPERQWGQFGTQAAPFLVLLQTILADLSPRPTGLGAYVVAQSVQLPLPAPSPLELLLSDGAGRTRVPVRSDRVSVPTVSRGAYQLHAEPAGPPLLTYSVNIAPPESDLTRIEDAALLARLPAGRTQIVHDWRKLPKPGQSAGARHLIVPLALALLALLCFESLFANRFYAAPAPERKPGAAVAA